MERALSSFDINIIVSELQDLIGSYIDKIFQLTRDELLIRITNKKTKEKEIIYVKNSEILCLTQKKFETPQKPSTFAMTLRKYLINGRLSEITQHEFDRIIKIRIKKKEAEYTLIFELFPNGNIILLNPEGIIILPLVKQEWAHRSIKSNKKYVPPPPQIDPFALTEEEFIELIKISKKDLVRTLAVNINLSGVYAEEICFRTGIDKNTKTNELSIKSIKKLYSELRKVLDIFKEKTFQPVFVKKAGKIIDILPIPFESYLQKDFEITDRFTRGLQEFISIGTKKKVKSKYQKKIEKLQRQLHQQRKTIEDFKKRIVEKKIEGELLYLHFQPCQELLHEISQVLQQKEKEEGIEQINKKTIVKNFDPTSNELIIQLQNGQGKTVEVELDFRKTVAENAENAYRSSKKFQEKLKGAQEALKQTRREIKTLEEKNIIEEEKVKIELKHFWFEQFRWFLSSEGNIVVAGRDAKTNELVIKKYLKEGDRYVHADIHGAPSCVVKSIDIYDKKTPISIGTLEEACVFAASYSKAWNQFGEAQTYWVLPEQVSKTPQSGEFLPKGAFVIRGKRNYHRCKLEVAIGEIYIDDVKKVMGGPLEAVKARAEKYMVLEPGDTKKSVISNTLSKVFNVSEEAVARALPPGNISIVKTIGFELK